MVKSETDILSLNKNTVKKFLTPIEDSGAGKDEELNYWQDKIGDIKLPTNLPPIEKSGLTKVAPKLNEIDDDNYRKLKYFRQWVNGLKDYENIGYDDYKDIGMWDACRKEWPKINKIYLKSRDTFDEHLGAGSFRAVYKATDDRVIKVAINPFGVPSNKYEANGFLQTSYPNLFPKTEFYDDDYFWIVMEKVSVPSAEEILNHFPKYQEFYKGTAIEQVRATTKLNLYIEEFSEYWLEYRTITNKGYTDEWRSQIAKGFVDERVPLDDPKFENISEIEKKTELLLENPDKKFKEIMAASQEFGVNVRDIRQGNLGVNKDGELLIIDASIF